MKPYKLDIFQGKDGQWYISLLHGNGRKFMTSEGYTRKGTAKKIARRFARKVQIDYGAWARGLPFTDRTKTFFEQEK